MAVFASDPRPRWEEGFLAVRHKLYQKDQKYWRLDRKRVRSDVAGKMMRLAVSILVAACVCINTAHAFLASNRCRSSHGSWGLKVVSERPDASGENFFCR